MEAPEIVRGFDASNQPDLAAVVDLVERATAHDGRRPMSDQHWLDLVHGSRPGFAGVLVRDEPGGAPLGYAQVSRANDGSTIELVLAPDVRSRCAEIVPALLASALGVIDHDGGGTVTWWVSEPTRLHEQLADQHGLSPDRRLLQMQRPLPTGLPVGIETRPFVVGVDDERWLEVNNRAFSDHGEQGGWDLAALRQRQAEPWFDPDGFLLHERDGRLAGFCWTKLHAELDPVVGEIYVVAVDPDFHGLGLGRQLTLAGLEAIAERGVDTAMLYVDAHNLPAVRLYEQLGFTIHNTAVAYVGPCTRKPPLHDS